MINIPEPTIKDIIRMLNNYVDELDNAIGVQGNSDDMIKYIEGEIANAESMISFLERKIVSVV